MIVSLIRTVYFLKLKGENTAVTIKQVMMVPAKVPVKIWSKHEGIPLENVNIFESILLSILTIIIKIISDYAWMENCSFLGLSYYLTACIPKVFFSHPKVCRFQFLFMQLLSGQW